jgi:hypothetical protein
VLLVSGCGEHWVFGLGAPVAVHTLGGGTPSFDPAACQAKPCCVLMAVRHVGTAVLCVVLALAFWDTLHSYYIYYDQVCHTIPAGASLLCLGVLASYVISP